MANRCVGVRRWRITLRGQSRLRTRLDENATSEPWQWQGGALSIDDRCAVHAPAAMSNEMPTYTYAPGDIPKVPEAWAKAVPAREELSPLAACWTSEIGGLNKFVHTWVYKDLAERDRVRAASRAPGRNWPPQSGVRPIRQENKLLIPAAFSPVR